MIYPLAALTAAMSGYMVWLVVFRLRRDRVLSQRDLTRGKFAFRRPKDRLRFLLKRSFAAPADKPEWEDQLVSGLTDVETTPSAKDPSQAHDQTGRP